MTYPLTTGVVADLLGTTEPTLNRLIRKRRLASIPLVAAGRRLWHEEHVREAARVLDVLTPRIDGGIRQAFAGSEVRHV